MQSMSESEKEIMKIIWNNGGTIYINKLLNCVDEQKLKWGRATVRTFLARLIEKGFITTRKQGKAAEYIVAVTEDEYLSGQATAFVNTVFNGSVKGLLTSLFGQDSLDKDALDNLEDFWEKAKEGLS